jgi:hypothetical protein
MASALDLIAAVGQTFGERPEAVRAMPRPPDLAFILCVFSLLWAGLWRGALRWLGVIFFAASIAFYIKAPIPLVAFDADTRAIYARVDGASAWTLIAAPGRSTYARDRLGAMLGLSPPTLERLAPPETCGTGGCAWRTADRPVVFVSEESGLPRACERGAIVISRAPAPADFAQRCQPAALIDANDLAQRGGALIYATEDGVRIERALSPAISRPWTPRGGASDQE